MNGSVFLKDFRFLVLIGLSVSIILFILKFLESFLSIMGGFRSASDGASCFSIMQYEDFVFESLFFLIADHTIDRNSKKLVTEIGGVRTGIILGLYALGSAAIMLLWRKWVLGYTGSFSSIEGVFSGYVSGRIQGCGLLRVIEDHLISFKDCRTAVAKIFTSSP